MTVSQASTVLAIRAADPRQGFRSLDRRGLGVGRAHLTATVNTLVLAYVGASLPVLPLFSAGGVDAFEAVNLELAAKEVVGTLVGSIGLIPAVPLTTALAAMPAERLRPIPSSPPPLIVTEEGGSAGAGPADPRV